jgi:hypothetical protein
MRTPRDSIYAGHRSPDEIISYAVWLYFRFPLSLRMVEEYRHLRARRPRPASAMTRVATPKRAIRSRRSTAGSPKASNHKTLERQRRCSTKWREPGHCHVPKCGTNVRSLAGPKIHGRGREWLLRVEAPRSGVGREGPESARPSPSSRNPRRSAIVTRSSHSAYAGEPS